MSTVACAFAFSLLGREATRGVFLIELPPAASQKEAFVLLKTLHMIDDKGLRPLGQRMARLSLLGYLGF